MGLLRQRVVQSSLLGVRWFGQIERGLALFLDFSPGMRAIGSEHHGGLAFIGRVLDGQNADRIGLGIDGHSLGR